MDAIEGFDIGGGGNIDPETLALLAQLFSGGGGMGAAVQQPPTGRGLPAANATAAIAGAPPAQRQAQLKPDIWNMLLNGGAAMMEAGGRPGATTLGALGTGVKHGLAADEARQTKQAQLDAALNNAEMRKWQAMLAAAGRQDTLAQQGAYREQTLSQRDAANADLSTHRAVRRDQIDRSLDERESMNQATRDHRAAMRAIAKSGLELRRDRATGTASVTPYQRAMMVRQTLKEMRTGIEGLRNEKVSDDELIKRAEERVEKILGSKSSSPATASGALNEDDELGADPETAQDPLDDDDDDAALFDYADVTETETVFPSTMPTTAAPTRRGTLRGQPQQGSALPNAAQGDLVPTGQFHPETGKPILRNRDGSHSSELSITVQVEELNGGRPTNIPTIWDGKQLSEDEAIGRALKSGQRFQAYNSIDEAVRAAGERSQNLGRTGPDMRQSAPSGRTGAPRFTINNPASPKSARAYAILESGDYFRDPQGNLRIKP